MPLLLPSSLAIILLSAALSAQGSGGPSPDRPCSFASADEVSAALGTKVSAATDEKFRCKYAVDKGWLETKLMDISLKMTKDIFDYTKTRGKPVPGLGDQAFVLGATLVAKVGDVIVSVDGSNLQRPPDTATLKRIATTIVERIP
jgi:hypothetical protein